MQIKLLFLILFTQILAFGELFDHLKPVENKGDQHKIDQIDFIYMINLDERPEKFRASCKQLHPYNIYPYRFSAVNGWKLSLDVINDVGVKWEPWMKKNILSTCYLKENERWRHCLSKTEGRTYFVHELARGPIGINLSHLSVIKDAYDSGYSRVWVMEDDIEVVKDPNVLSELIVKLDDLVKETGWDILFTDRDYREKTKTGAIRPVPAFKYDQDNRRLNFTPRHPERFLVKKKISKDFRKIGARFGAHSYIISRSGMRKILNFFKKYNIYLPFDIDFYAPNNIRMFTVLEDVVANLPGAASDNPRPRYEL